MDAIGTYVSVNIDFLYAFFEHRFMIFELASFVRFSHHSNMVLLPKLALAPVQMTGVLLTSIRSHRIRIRVRVRVSVSVSVSICSTMCISRLCSTFIDGNRCKNQLVQHTLKVKLQNRTMERP